LALATLLVVAPLGLGLNAYARSVSPEAHGHEEESTTADKSMVHAVVIGNDQDFLENTFPHEFENADLEPVLYDGSEITWRISTYSLIVRDNNLLLAKSKLEKYYDFPPWAGFIIGVVGFIRHCNSITKPRW